MLAAPPRHPAIRGRRRRQVAAVPLCVGLLGVVGGVSGDTPEGEPDPPDPQASTLAEQVEVRLPAGRLGEAPLGSAVVTLEPADSTGSPRALTDVVTTVSGVAENGQGGLFQVYSIRGVSRQRVTAVLAGMRLTSERRAGTSSSFVDPLLMQRVEVLRGPATTLYGSGALGGVVRVEPRTYASWGVDLGYDGNGGENHQVVGAGSESWSIGLARREAQDGEAADGTPLHSRFRQYSAVLRAGWKRGSARYELIAIPSVGSDIGKPNTDFPVRTTDYLSERHGLLRFAAESDRDWRFEAALHGQELETRVVETDTRLQSNVFNDSLDAALRWQAGHEVGASWSLRYGVEGFGRTGVDAEEFRRDLDASDEPPTVQRSLDGGRETELGVHASARFSRGPLRWELGLRAAGIEQANAGEPSRGDEAFSGHAGIVRSVGEGVQLRGSLSSGVRFPSLTELFFRGTTGRGLVVGNPGLTPERALSAEIGTQWATKATAIEATAFGTLIDDYIERIETAPDAFTFANATSGRIRGIELQGLVRPGPVWSLHWGGHWIDGEDDAGTPLADTPPPELRVAVSRTIERWQVEAGLTWRGRRDEAGPGEKAVPSAELLEAKLRYRWNDAWEVALGGTNLLDQVWFPSADEKASPGAGRSFSLRLVRRDI